MSPNVYTANGSIFMSCRINKCTAIPVDCASINELYMHVSILCLGEFAICSHFITAPPMRRRLEVNKDTMSVFPVRQKGRRVLLALSQLNKRRSLSY